MRQDQYERLQALAERLTDVFLDEADPDTWPGAGVAVAAMDKSVRGDRYWVKKNAAATGVLMGKVEQLVGRIQADSNAGHGAAAVQDDENQLDKQIDAAERDAERLLSETLAKARKTAFDKKVHGKT